MRTVDVQQRGKKGTIVASRNRFGQYIKEYIPPEQPATASQREVWGNMTDLWPVWHGLSDERMDAWGRLGEQVQSRSTLAQSGPLDGHTVFRKLNTVLQTCRRPVLLDPPPLPAFGPNPVTGFAVRERKGGVALKLRLRPDLRWEERPALEDLMVYAWTPCRPGVRRNSHYAFLGLLPAPVKGEWDITRLYLNKLKEWRRLENAIYHIPLEGSRVFVQVWQQVNGWENELGRFVDDARVSARTWPR
jgi:hypothetical protein